MTRDHDINQLVERLIECDEPLNEGDMELFRRNLGVRLARAQRRMRMAFMSIVVCIPLLILGLILLHGATSVPRRYPESVIYPATVLSAATAGVIGLAIVWLIFFFIPRYFRARGNFRDSILTMLVQRVDELSRRIDSMKSSESGDT